MKPLAILLLFMIATVIAQTSPTKKTVDDRLKEFGEIVRQRLEPKFQAVGLPYPPARVTLLGFKQERLLEVHAAASDGLFRFVRSYPVLAASGVSGPKLREGDRQVPEGIYRVRELNPNSLFHLSIWLNYPNGHDRLRAATEQRSNLGGEIMIHGKAASKGCLAMGDPAAEDLFVLTALTGIQNVKVILAPSDLRKKSAPPLLPSSTPAWTGELYKELKRELSIFRTPGGLGSEDPL